MTHSNSQIYIFFPFSLICENVKTNFIAKWPPTFPTAVHSIHLLVYQACQSQRPKNRDRFYRAPSPPPYGTRTTEENRSHYDNCAQQKIICPLVMTKNILIENPPFILINHLLRKTIQKGCLGVLPQEIWVFLASI